MRPTGKLHLGNYMGALANWVKLQDTAQYECYFFIADWHALTTDYADPSRLKLNTLDLALDWLAAGLDPGKSTIFIQSHVLQHAELNLLLGMMTPLGWLERVPTYKEQQENLNSKDLTNFGFLGYPVLMASDILLYQTQFVPVGQDQTAHVELTREVARRFNSMYKTSVFPEPEALFTPSPKLPGTDGRKMSKSYGNTIGLTEDPRSVAQKVETMSTSGQRPRHTDSGDPDQCPVGDLHKVFSSADVVAETQAGCRTASIGCKECKALAAKSVSEHVAPIYARRRELEADVDSIWDLLQTESKKAETRAEETMVQVREVLGLSRSLGDVKESFSVQLKSEMAQDIDNDGWLDVRYQTNTLNDSENMRTWEECVPLFRADWLRKMVPREVALKKPKGDFENQERELEEPFITASGKRVLFTVSEHEPQVDVTANGKIEKWFFNIPQRSYEVWKLLLYRGHSLPMRVGFHGDSYITSYVVPQKFFSQEFARAKKSSNKDERIRVEVMKEGGKFSLKIANSNYSDITTLHNYYEPLK